MAVWDGCACHKLEFIRDQCLEGMFPSPDGKFMPMPWCPMSVEKLIDDDRSKVRLKTIDRYKYPCLDKTCTHLVTRPGILCKVCRKKERSEQMCLL